MKSFKTQLLAATVVAGFAVSNANAQTALPGPGPNDGDNALHGAGATSIQNILVQELNCIGRDHQLGVSGLSGTQQGSFKTEPAGAYTPTNPTATDPAFTCTTGNSGGNGDIQDNFNAKYVATGSGFGREMWREFAPDFQGTPTNGAPGVAGVFNPFQTLNGDNPWTHLQFAFSDTPITPGDLVIYYNGTTTSATGTVPGAFAEGTGPAIQFPKYVLPVAIAYNPVYGVNANGVQMRFNVRTDATINGVVAGGLRMQRTLYCGIFNGTITNWNDPAFKVGNHVDLHDPVNDTASRFASQGVPIRLVGRLDRSGTTDVFTRHLAAVCGTAADGNKYTANAESLPYNPSSGTDLSNVRSDTGYQAGTPYPVAGTTNLVGNTYFNGTAIVQNNNTGPSAQPNGNQGSGLYLVGDGSGRVRDAINLAPDYVLGNVTLNGKIGYISADFIKPAPQATLYAAALQVGTSAAFEMPSVTNALLAFGSGTTAILPPQSDSVGKFTNSDSRMVRDQNGNSVTASRDNPIAWTDVLYADPNNTLAAPNKGYPITGTTQYYGYTCYANAGNRYDLVEFLALNFGKVTATDDNMPLSASTFKGTTVDSLGIVPQSNIGVMPNAWQAAISETFLKKSAQVASDGTPLATYGNAGQGLWMQDRYLFVAGKPLVAKSNPSCTAGQGA